MAVITIPRPTFPPSQAASTWSAIVKGQREIFTRRKAPMTNAEAVAFVREWRDVSTGRGTLWGQFAAAAYGYAPPRQRGLVTTAKQANAPYPSTLREDLWRWAASIASELDARAADEPHPPRMTVDKDTWNNPMWFGQVVAATQPDGANIAPRAKPATAKPQSSIGVIAMLALAFVLLSPKRRRGG